MFKNFKYILPLIYLILGIILLAVPAANIINTIYTILGIGLILFGIIQFIGSQSDKITLSNGILDIVIGILFIFFHNEIVMIILAVLFIIFPIVRIIQAADKKLQFKIELPALIIGLLIAFCGDTIMTIMVKVIGAVLVVLAIYLFITRSDFKTLKRKKKPNTIDAKYEERD